MSTAQSAPGSFSGFRGAPGSAALRIAGISKRFGELAVLRGIDLDVAAGELVAILGPSGCGKTTLLRLIAGFDVPDAGTIAVGDRTVTDGRRAVAPERRGIGYVAQEGALFPHLSVGHNIGYGLPRAARRNGHRIAELLDLVGLPADCARRYPHQLSGGQQQRVALARALAPGPALVLLDEPFSSLDAGLRAETREAVVAALAASGATAVLVTHDQAEALSLAARVAVMRDGRLVQVAVPDELYRNPADLGVAAFVGEAVIVPATVTAGVADSVLGPLPVRGTAAGAARLMIRPEQIVLARPGTPDAVTARVERCVYYGHDATVRLRLAGGAEVTARCTGHSVPLPGEDVAVRVDGAAIAYPAPTGAPEPAPVTEPG